MTAPANSIAEFYEAAVPQLENAGLSFGHGCTCAEDEVAWLISATLDIPFDELDKFWSDTLTDEQRTTLTQRLDERCETKAPLAYILGEAWLGPYIFKIDRRVIVPRSFIAELLMVDLSPWVQNPDAITRVADICTGSGCLAILSALHFPPWKWPASTWTSMAYKIASSSTRATSWPRCWTRNTTSSSATHPMWMRHPWTPSRMNIVTNPKWPWPVATMASTWCTPCCARPPRHSTPVAGSL